MNPLRKAASTSLLIWGFRTEEHLAKAGLTVQIIEIICQRRLNQSAAAAILGIDQPKISALLRGQLKNFSLDRLCRFLNALDKDVHIVVKDKPKSPVRARRYASRAYGSVAASS
jgi:predicted XRE-type DNA-binding protein